MIEVATKTREYVSVTDLCLDEKYWEPVSGEVYKTGHSHLGSAIETYDSCGNCDGAKCDICKTIVRGLRWECIFQVDEAEEMLVQKGVPREEARDIVTCDGSYTPESNYGMITPYELELQDTYPDFYKKINKTDKDVMKTISYVIDKYHPTVYADLENKVLDHFGLEGQARYRGHIPNQLRLYWIRNKKNHKLACKIKEEICN